MCAGRDKVACGHIILSSWQLVLLLFLTDVCKI